MVILTDKAVIRFKDVVEKHRTFAEGIRIFVVPGG